MGFEDILTVLGVILGIVIPMFFKFDDKANQILDAILLTKTSFLAEFVDKIENKIRNDLVYDDGMETFFSSFIKQTDIAFDNKKGIEKYIRRYSKYTSRLVYSAISIFFITAVKYLWILLGKYCEVSIYDSCLDIGNFLIIINFCYSVFCISKIWNAYVHFRSLSEDIKKQADLIV